MFRRRFLSLIIATAIGTVVLGGPSRSEAALRLVVTDGTTTDVFYSTSQTTLSTGTFTIGRYTDSIQTLVTNYPGNSTFGTMSTTVNITSISTPPSSGPPDLTVTVDEIVAVAGLSTGLQTGANATAVQSAALLAFTGPSSSPVLVTADSSDSINPSVTSGTITTFTRYNGSEVVSEAAPLTGPSPPMQTVTKTNSGTYTLGQRLLLQGLDSAASSFNFTGNSSVEANPVPAPAGLLLCLSGLPILGIRQWLRRRQK
jgi:hypothetical protein